MSVPDIAQRTLSHVAHGAGSVLEIDEALLRPPAVKRHAAQSMLQWSKVDRLRSKVKTARGLASKVKSARRTDLE
eukprot:2762026-Rhodomonas_salina.2